MGSKTSKVAGTVEIVDHKVDIQDVNKTMKLNVGLLLGSVRTSRCAAKRPNWPSAPPTLLTPWRSLTTRMIYKTMKHNVG